MYVAIAGLVLLGFGGPMLMIVVLEHVLKIKSKSRDRSLIEHTFNLPNRFPPYTGEALPHSAAAHAFATAASDGEVQVG